MTRASVTPPAMIANTWNSVAIEPPTASVSSANCASRTHSPTTTADSTPATGGIQAGRRVNNRPITTTIGTAANTTGTDSLTFSQISSPYYACIPAQQARGGRLNVKILVLHCHADFS